MCIIAIWHFSLESRWQSVLDTIFLILLLNILVSFKSGNLFTWKQAACWKGPWHILLCCKKTTDEMIESEQRLVCLSLSFSRAKFSTRVLSLSDLSGFFWTQQTSTAHTAGSQLLPHFFYLPRLHLSVFKVISRPLPRSFLLLWSEYILKVGTLYADGDQICRIKQWHVPTAQHHHACMHRCSPRHLGNFPVVLVLYQQGLSVHHRF